MGHFSTEPTSNDPEWQQATLEYIANSGHLRELVAVLGHNAVNSGWPMNPDHDILTHPIPIDEIETRILKDSLHILEEVRGPATDGTIEPTKLTEFGKIVVKRFSLDTDALAQGQLRVVDTESDAEAAA